ncbi:hypothetical protein SPOG_05030 [Schizosaccharomyces cryophilus OY26]|uniref:Uncharacterized protein n=1 Tax=Schizosaccharomyces cryophilus (strain OY26 / ATCC MYA-4695 / CBS 11777 / NBRC 106824 / NRRL Y48691) TaxID=653667 RepID=S9X8C5_SCHCR|nr:uncharacterized protein SPOG_05030 [Schizosaccharomyces cryophilus OY26]EPY53347.1 hypothetical protein SPOG_05030 [Schizosaccharomyces cryophilus OY26]
MNEKENEKLLGLAKAAEYSCQVSPASPDSDLPQYSELSYSHLDNLEKGCLCLHPNLVPENKRDELSDDASATMCSDYCGAFCGSVKSGFLYISSPAAFARIPPAAKRTTNEGLRVFWCYLFSLILDFSFSYYVLFPFLKNNMLKDTSIKVQYSVAAILIVLAFWFSLNLVSVLLDLLIFSLDLLPLLASAVSNAVSKVLSVVFDWISKIITYSLGYEMTFEGTESTGENQLPIHAIPLGNLEEPNNPNSLRDEEPSSERFEQYVRRQHHQSRDTESGKNLQSSS